MTDLKMPSTFYLRMALVKAHLTGSINSDNIETVISKDGVFSGTESMLTTVDEQSWLCA